MSFKLNSEPVNTNQNDRFRTCGIWYLWPWSCRTSAFPITKCKYLLVSHQQTSIITPNAEIAFEICKFSLTSLGYSGPRLMFAHAKCFQIHSLLSLSHLPFTTRLLSKHCVVHGSWNTIRSPTLRDDASPLEPSLFCGLNRDIIKFCVHPNRYTIKTQLYKLVHPKSERRSNVFYNGITQLRFQRHCCTQHQNNNTENVVKLNAMRCFYLWRYYHITNCHTYTVYATK